MEQPAKANRRTQGAPRETETLLRLVVQNAPIVLFAIDTSGDYTLLEGQGLSALGLQPGEAVGRSVFDLFRNVPTTVENVKGALNGQPFRDTVSVGDLVFDTYCAPFFAADGTVSGAIGVATDITDRKRLEDGLRKTMGEVQKKSEELEAFTYSVSHDLKEPLRTLEAFSGFLMEDYADRLDDAGKDFLTKLARASARMKQLIDDLLALSRIARVSEAPVPVDVRHAIADMVESMRATLDERHGSVEVDGDLPQVLGDATRVAQIFGNLIGNGIKFNQSDAPRVTVGLHGIEGGEAVFYVRDNGIGIDPEYHERVFGIFQRLHGREEYEGTGAGLAISKRAVETLGGRMWLESELGAGATFLFTLPLATQESGKERIAA